jgi:hypothetical protein
VSKRLQIVLPDPAAAELGGLAASSDQPAATIASLMVRNELALASNARTRSARSAQPPVSRGRVERARWLEPYGGSASWRAEMWGAIVALHGRYPRALGALKDQWWTDDSHVETLCALVAWRGEIDAGGSDPREELAFQSALADYARTLKTEGGGVADAWEPGAPPRGWAAGRPPYHTQRRDKSAATL